MNVPCYCTSLRNAARRLTAAYDAALAPVGVGAAQFALLRGVDSSEAVGLSELGENLDLDRSTVGRNVRVLEKIGLIQTGAGADQRGTYVTLTAAGRQVLKKGAPLWEKAQSEFEARIGLEQAQGLRNALHTV
ncbi:MarR family winged helix-turn-helix transcriptional regulator [Paraburkholderia sp. SIMBA_009]|uniref:MarR family winged helix-turn-helix transcriptional regulator n=1 Tax=Paraburkholderia TaxID=1822464 RepID=UPI000D753803|nr:MarR family winged helix-turn-helix transcriptional regulator [Paraburkholderia tropica]QNB17393.1 winged helix-turn-helix transcriptional regulator [Paraburkholderia tropica]